MFLSCSGKADGVFCISALTFVRTFQVVKEAIASVDGYNADRREAVRKAAQSLNLKTEAAMAIFSKAVCILPLKNDTTLFSPDLL